eukprot:TRINITY_DN83521_c0_g1_i3.p1 TRINITY_DN83521_c0_g1~~TRINITY_DN83521_c0_g1_i3.p1  ORF type:complete len:114 (-),score=14.33 TRINITY_DN83521_c0_g1_i3:186-527(-)
MTETGGSHWISLLLLLFCFIPCFGLFALVNDPFLSAFYHCVLGCPDLPSCVDDELPQYPPRYNHVSPCVSEVQNLTGDPRTGIGNDRDMVLMTFNIQLKKKHRNSSPGREFSL